MQARMLYTLHILNAIVGCFCAAVLGLTTRALILASRLTPQASLHVQGIGVGLLMWPGAGGVVDTLLFLGILVAGEKRNFVRCSPHTLHA